MYVFISSFYSFKWKQCNLHTHHFTFSVTAFNKVHENQLHRSVCPAMHSLSLFNSFTRNRSYSTHYLMLLPSSFCSMHVTLIHSFSNTSLHVALKNTFYAPLMIRLTLSLTLLLPMLFLDLTTTLTRSK